MKIGVIGACSDLGLSIDGTDKGPLIISKNLNKKINKFIIVSKNNVKKSYDKNDLKKNLSEVNIFNSKLYKEALDVIEEKHFPITIGGDHSISIGSALASQTKNKNLGIIWIDAHLDYNTFETTITGNLHGLPLSSINGLCTELTPFFKDNFYNPKNTVVVGYRAKEANKEKELNNIKKQGVTVFDNDDIKKYGIDNIMNKAILIASNNTNGFHVSFDLDIIDKKYAPGVSVPEKDGIDDITAYKIIDILCNNINKIKSFDLVEYNPIFDNNNKTLEISLNILNKIIEKK